MTASAKTILVVENEPGIRSLCVLILEAIDGITLAAKTVDEAIRMSREHAGKIDLLLTDFSLSPDMDGGELSAYLTRFDPTLKTLYISGLPKQFFIQNELLNARGAAYLGKPFLARELLNAVNALLAVSPGAERATGLTV